jgi:hypothetical protein
MTNKIIPDERVRQGPKGKPVLGVLIGALILCAVAMTGFMMWAGSDSPDSSSQEAARQSNSGSSSGSSGNPTNRISPANPAYPAPAEPSATGATNR